jgi:SNF2 family DNA or RNA helicase
MATLGLVTGPDGVANALRLVCSFQENELANAIPGCRWNGGNKEWRFPLSELTIIEAKRQFPNLGLLGQCDQWYHRVMNRRDELVQMKKQIDTDISWAGADKLYPYQRVDIQTMNSVTRMLNANDMGVGKTVESLVASEIRGHQKCLIVCKNIGKWTWAKNGIERWLNSDDYVIVDGGASQRRKQYLASKSHKFTIINHELVQYDPEIYQQNWDLVILDEAHKYKNRKAIKNQPTKKYIEKGINGMYWLVNQRCSDLYLLTGSPILSKNWDMWSYLHMIDPKRFSSFWNFVYRHHEVEDGDYGKEISDRVKDTAFMHFEVEPYMIRRLKTDPEVKQYLPDKSHKTVYVNMNATQRKLYRQMADDMEAEHDGVLIAAPVVVAKITRLRQIAVAPDMLWEGVESPKIQAAIDFIEDVPGKVVVFSMFERALVRLAYKLRDAKIEYTWITGSVADNEERFRRQDEFNNNPSVRVMLITIETGGETIDLTGSSTTLFLDRHWNPPVNEQAEDRLYRHGQKDNVLVVNLALRDSIEEWMDELETKKVNLIDAVVNRNHELVRILRR